MGELNIYGVYVPILLIQAIVAYVIFWFVMPWLNRLTEKQWIVLPNIFYLCVYIMLFGSVHWAGLFI